PNHPPYVVRASPAVRTAPRMRQGNVPMNPDPNATGAYGAAAAVPAERFAPGVVLAGRYRIVAALGKGGMGEVWRADDLTLGQPVALKFLPERVADDPDRLARFRKEVAVARKVSHPNCSRLYDLGESPRGADAAPLPL